LLQGDITTLKFVCTLAHINDIHVNTGRLNQRIYMFIKTAGFIYKSIQKIIHKNNLILYKTKTVIIHCSYVAINSQNALLARFILGKHHVDNQYLVFFDFDNKTLSHNLLKQIYHKILFCLL